MQKYIVTMLAALSLIAVIFACLFLISGSGSSATTVPEGDESAAVEAFKTTLAEAKTVELKKAPLSFGVRYKVLADGEKVGELRGEVLPVLGDTFSLVTTDDVVVASEDEQVLRIARTAKVYDEHRNQTGVIEQKLISLLYESSYKPVEGDGELTLKTNFDLRLKGAITDAEGTDQWSYSGKYVSLGAHVTLTREDEDADAIAAIFLTSIANEIYEAESDDSSHNK